MPPITDPADRLSGEFVEALEERYDGVFAADPDDHAARYGNVCDLIVQLLWADSYGASPDDQRLHTSAPARTIARLIFHAAGIED